MHRTELDETHGPVDSPPIECPAMPTPWEKSRFRCQSMKGPARDVVTPCRDVVSCAGMRANPDDER